MNHYLSHIVFCNVQHKEEKIIGYCLNEYCNEESTYCNQCQRTKHQTHPQDCKSMMEVAQLVSDAYGMVLEWQKKAQTELENVKKIYYDIEKYLHIQQMRLIELENFIQNNQHQVTIDYQRILKSYYRLLPQKKDLSSVQLFGEKLENLHKFYKSLNEIQIIGKQNFQEIPICDDIKTQFEILKKDQSQLDQNDSYDGSFDKNSSQDSDLVGLDYYKSYVTGEILIFGNKDQNEKQSECNEHQENNLEGKPHQLIKQENYNQFQDGLGNKGENIKAFSHAEQHSSSVTTDSIPLLNFSSGHPLQIPQRVHEEDKINITVTKQELEN